MSPDDAIRNPLQVGRAPRDALKVGVLVPRSTIYPQLGRNFLAGLLLGFDGKEMSSRAAVRGVAIIAKELGVGGGGAMRAAQELLEGDRVDLAIGLIGSGQAARLAAPFAAAGHPLIAATLGENIPRRREEPAAIVHHSLDLWRAEWALGAWAATNLGRRAVVAQSFYDSGYDAPYAFRLGFERAGGEVVHSYVTHLLPEMGALALLTVQVEELRPDLVYAAYCGPAAVEFVRAYAGTGLLVLQRELVEGVW